MCLPELFEYPDCLFSFRGFAVTGQACQYQMIEAAGRPDFSRKIERDWRNGPLVTISSEFRPS